MSHVTRKRVFGDFRTGKIQTSLLSYRSFGYSRLICTFVVCIWRKTHFRMTWSKRKRFSTNLHFIFCFDQNSWMSVCARAYMPVPGHTCCYCFALTYAKSEYTQETLMNTHACSWPTDLHHSLFIKRSLIIRFWTDAYILLVFWTWRPWSFNPFVSYCGLKYLSCRRII